MLQLTNGNEGQFSYDEFLREKVAFDRRFGFEVEPTAVNPILKPHQRDMVRWAISGGRRAIFARFGLGKTLMQLELLRLALTHPSSAALGGRALVVAPLRVQREFVRDASKLLGIEARFIRRTAEIDDDWAGIYITNYESVRDRKLDVSLFDAVSLDEAAVLAGFGSDTAQAVLDLFSNTTYRFLATATPSPNEYLELINYAAFLGVMDRAAALTRFFQRDSTKAGNLTLYPHKEAEFWLWLNTWACFLQRPSDLGYSDDGYELPPIDVQWHEVQVDIASTRTDRDGQGLMFRGGAMSSVEAAREKRSTIAERLAKTMDIVRAHREAAPDDQIILWCDLNDEQAAIEKALKAEGMTFSSVHGGLTDEEAERRLDEWCDKETYALIGKPIMLGQGMNLQQACVSVFVGVTYKFRHTIQAVHRIHRFGQTRPCEVHLILAETETEVRDKLQQKWANHEQLTDKMSEIIRRYALASIEVSKELSRAMGIERELHTGDGWTVALNDSVIEARDHMEENSVGLIVTSIPFGNHFEYSLNYADFGHTENSDEFWWQNDYLTPSLLKVLKPGRILAVHVKDRMLYGKMTGAGRYTVSPLHAEAIAHYTGHGFDYYGMITVTTDVVRENNQTYRLGYSKMLKDHTPMGVGSPEYVLLFGKPQTDRSKGWADERVTKHGAPFTCSVHDEMPAGENTDDWGECDPGDPCSNGYSVGQWQIDASAEWRTGGNRVLSLEELSMLDPATRTRLFTEQSVRTVYDYDAHVRLATELAAKKQLPSTFAALVPGSWRDDVWTDILRIDTLNSEQKRRNVEQHICPFPLDIPRRLINMYSNPGDVVYDPFNGIGSTVLCAVEAGREGYGSELNPASVADSLVYLRRHDARASVPTLFDLLDAEAAS